MARKSRMGRNLDALLHGVAKERREAPSERSSAEETADARPAVRDERHAAPAAAEPPPSVPAGSSSDPAHAEGRGAELAVVRVRPSEPGDGTVDRSAGTPEAGSGPATREAHEGREASSGERVGRVVRASASATATPGVEVTGAGAAAIEAATAGARVAPGEPPAPGDRLRMIGVERIRRGVFQPRRFFDQEALQELADSLKAQGMIQPIIVRPFGGAFELIAGERRWRAAQIAGLAEIPAIVREMEDRSVAAVSLIENIQREDLNPLEEAQALTRLCDEFGMTHASVAESIGRSRASVSNLMRLLELHDEVKVMVDKGELDMGHARALLRVPRPDQPALAARVVKQGLTVRAVEKLIRTGVDKDAAAKTGSAATDPDIERLIERLSGVLGAPVSIRHKPAGSGRLEIRYGSLEELDGILAHIK